MPYPVTGSLSQLALKLSPLLPLGLALWIGWHDLKTRRIPNYLTLGVVLSGLVFQVLCHGWWGLADGALGLFIGFALLFLPYLLGGMGAGDVKALAALGTWLGPVLVLYLFFYMVICGAVIALGVLCWKGKLWSRIVTIKATVVNSVLCRVHGLKPAPVSVSQTESIPFGVALALGMVLLLIKGVS